MTVYSLLPGSYYRSRFFFPGFFPPARVKTKGSFTCSRLGLDLNDIITFTSVYPPYVSTPRKLLPSYRMHTAVTEHVNSFRWISCEYSEENAQKRQPSVSILEQGKYVNKCKIRNGFIPCFGVQPDSVDYTFLMLQLIVNLQLPAKSHI